MNYFFCVKDVEFIVDVKLEELNKLEEELRQKANSSDCREYTKVLNGLFLSFRNHDITFKQFITELGKGTVEEKKKDLKQLEDYEQYLSSYITKSHNSDELDELMDDLKFIRDEISLLKTFDKEDEIEYGRILDLIHIKRIKRLNGYQKRK